MKLLGFVRGEMREYSRSVAEYEDEIQNPELLTYPPANLSAFGPSGARPHGVAKAQVGPRKAHLRAVERLA